MIRYNWVTFVYFVNEPLVIYLSWSYSFILSDCTKKIGFEKLLWWNQNFVLIYTNEQRILQVSQAPNLTDSPALRRSLFSNIPPTSKTSWNLLIVQVFPRYSVSWSLTLSLAVNFMLHNEMSANQLTDDLRKQLKWKLSNITPAIVKRCAR